MQDATFQAHINIRPYGSVRLSNFADLAAVLGEEKFPVDVLEAVIAALERHGYRYVPFAVFGLPFEEHERINGNLFNQLLDYV